MTILFKSDWKKYPRAIIHYETSNKSFLKIANVYNRMGVENCAFMLSLTQPELKDIDPHSTNLSFEIQQKIIAECKINFWYYIREVLKVPVSGSLQPVSFRADRSNIAAYWLFFNHVTTLITIIRQTGKTTFLMTLANYLLNIGTTNAFINLLTKSEGLKAETMAKLKALFEELPDYVNFAIKKDIFNSDECNVGVFKNKIKGNLSSSSPKQAEKVGRGFTSPINLIDEAAFVENISIAMGAMLMSGNAARRFAREQGNPYGTVMVTTAGDIDDRDGSYIYEIVNNSTLMSELFYDCNDLDDLNDTIFKNSRARDNKTKRPIVLLDYSYRQLGYDDVWLKQQLSDNISTEDNIKRDLFNMWVSGNSESPIPKEYINKLRENAIEEPRKQFYDPHNYLIYKFISDDEIDELIAKGDSFVAGIDTSDGVGRDDIAMMVRSSFSGEIIMAAIFNETNLITLADFFVSFLQTYPNLTMIIERKSSAVAIIDYMIHKLSSVNINPFTRLYNTIYQHKEKYADEYKEISRARGYDMDLYTKHKKHIGFVTSGTGITARSELYSTTLLQMLKYTSETTRFKTLIDQIAGLVVRNNRMDHPVGGSDDAVIASLLSYWMLTVGRNLGDYGIDANRVLKYNRVYLEDKFKSISDEIDEKEMMDIENEINDLIEELKNERDPLISRKLEVRIMKLAKEVNRNDSVITAVGMIEDIQKKKRMNRLR